MSKICNSCGTANQDDTALFCPNCGTAYEQEATQNATENVEQNVEQTVETGNSNYNQNNTQSDNTAFNQGYTQAGGQGFNQGPAQNNSQNMFYSNAGDQKSKMAAGLLGIFLGGLGIHNFYLGYTSKAVIQLCLTLIGWIACGLGPIAAWIWGLIEGIMILSGSVETDANGVPLKE